MSSSKQETLSLLCKILDQFQWLLNAYNLDYFLDAHWCKLPAKWQEALRDLERSDIPLLLNSSSHTKRVLPLSLLSLRAASSQIRRCRSMVNDPTLLVKSSTSSETSQSLSFSSDHSLPAKPLNTWDHILSKKIKLKKRHEIDRLCKLIPPLMTMADNCSDIVDCGSGQGHLDRILALCHGYRIFSIEGDCENINNAATRDTEVLAALRKHNLTEMVAEDMPTKLNCFLLDKNDIASPNGNHLLLGLHACGPLSNLILERFANNQDATCLVLVCCCYMKDGLEKFPMSTFLQHSITFKLTRSAKELACHAIEKFLSKFNSKTEVDSLNEHGYRFCLEALIEKHDPSKRHKATRTVKIDHSMTFKQYVLKATRGWDLSIPEAEFESELVHSMLQQMDRALAFYSLRLLLAPLVEMFILLDYQQYLEEHPQVKRTLLVPLFEPSISPRNLILVAHK